MSVIINNVYDIEDIIYLKTDAEQLSRIVFAYIVTKDSVLYRCNCGTQVSDHYAFEMSYERDKSKVL